MKASINKVKKEEISFAQSLKIILQNFPPRSREIVFARFGLFGSKALTLEEIGKKYNITRERIRQVINEVIKKVKEKENDTRFFEIKKAILLVIEKNGGIIKKEKILEILGKSKENEVEALQFFLECIDEIRQHKVNGEISLSYSLNDFDIELWKEFKKTVVNFLEENKKTFNSKELFDIIVNMKNIKELSLDIFHNFLDISEEIEKNNFDKWGLAHWREISPKGTREKAYLILKEMEGPLHFRDIAKKIDEHKLNRRKTHPQTVHNELIKDRNFVLVGRGIYALVEWGFQKGTVKDVIKDIISKNSKKFKKDDIIKEVLKIRQVKKSTVIINLNNYFIKLKDGSYSIKK